MARWWLISCFGVTVLSGCGSSSPAPGCDVLCDKLSSCGTAPSGCERQCSNSEDAFAPAVQDAAEESVFLCWGDYVDSLDCSELESGPPSIPVACWDEVVDLCTPAAEMSQYVDSVCDRAVACWAGTTHDDCVMSFLTEQGMAAFPCFTAEVLDAIETCFLDDYCEDGVAFGTFVESCALEALQ